MAKNLERRRFDLIVIGAGSGGMAAALRAAEGGLAVAVFDDRAIGGTCVNRGCVPKKLLVHAARGADRLAALGDLGWARASARFVWGDLRASVEARIAALSRHHGERLAGAGISVIGQRARLIASDAVEAGGQRFAADAVVLATGAAPLIPRIPGAGLCLTSDDLFTLVDLPRSLAIIGGGYIAVEFASMLVRLDVKVSLFEQAGRLIAPFDAEVAALLRARLEADGVEIHLGAAIDGIAKGEDGYVLRGAGIAPGGRFDRVVMAVGRRPNSGGLNLDAIGVATDRRGAITVDDLGRTGVDGIHAVGDVTGGVALTPVAVRQGRRVADLLLGRAERLPAPAVIPTAAFTTPECAAVGLGEEEARHLGHDIDLRRSRFVPLTGMLSEAPETVFMKAVIERGSRRVLGLHFFGPHASEAAQLGAVALSAGLDERQLLATMALHPTVSEEVIGLARGDAPLHGSVDSPVP